MLFEGLHLKYFAKCLVKFVTANFTQTTKWIIKKYILSRSSIADRS